MESSLIGQYEAVQHGSGFFFLEDPGHLRISGEDRIAFLQRQTTNDLQRLSSARGLATVLTSPTARILDVLYLFPTAETLQATTLPGLGARTASFLKRRVFFMDKVTIEDVSSETVQVELLGPQAGALLARLGLPRLPEEGEIATIHFEHKASGFLFSPGRSFSLGYRLLIPTAAGQALPGLFLEAGAVALDPGIFQVLRVEAGLPAAGSELNEEYTPLETGLNELVSDHKGCYTGQEIIARQITYDKVTQHLCGLRLEQIARPGDRVWADGKPVGVLTSTVESPRFGPIGLAVLKRQASQPGTPVLVGSQPETAFPAEINRLPFGQTS